MLFMHGYVVKSETVKPVRKLGYCSPFTSGAGANVFLFPFRSYSPFPFSPAVLW